MRTATLLLAGLLACGVAHADAVVVKNATIWTQGDAGIIENNVQQLVFQHHGHRLVSFVKSQVVHFVRIARHVI